jgi:alpha-beta hydrolase superfamily lysophospholipase
MSFEEYVALDGERGTIVLRVRRHPDPTHAAVLIYGYGDRTAVDRLAAAGATVVVPMHGPGGDPGDAGDYAADLHTVMQWVVAGHPGRPVLMIGHPTGEPIGTRYAESFGAQLVESPR